MAEQGSLWQWLIDAVDAHRSAALLIVTGSQGSTPGKAGAKMAVTANACMGTIGGGLIEAGLVEIARSNLSSGKNRPQIFHRAHHPSSTLECSGMICGGEQSVLIYPCKPEDGASFKRLLESYRFRTPVNLCISPQGLRVITVADFDSPKFADGDDWHYLETIGQYKRAYIVGAGHVGSALSRLLHMLDFAITVIDDREPFDMPPDDAYVLKKWGIAYSDIAEHVPEGRDVFVFIMTHDYHSDELVLSKLVGKRFAYLGLLGSRHKIAQLKKRLDKTWPDGQMQHFYAPMGLAINSHTPEEIAISIAAELIQLLNSKT